MQDLPGIINEFVSDHQSLRGVSTYDLALTVNITLKLFITKVISLHKTSFA